MNAVLEQISKIGIVPVVKIDNAADALPLAKALCAGGLPCAEVTFRTSAAAEAIKIMTDNFPSMCVGAGTDLNAEQVDAAVAAGAPENIISWIEDPSLEMKNLQMKEADIILATGGPGMVKAAYSSGKPALGVGAGNTPAIIDDTADITLAVNSIIHSKTFDNGMICASEQSVIVLDKVYKQVKKEFADRGCYYLNAAETEKVR